jgi:accessory colonization factor AcfC
MTKSINCHNFVKLFTFVLLFSLIAIFSQLSLADDENNNRNSISVFGPGGPHTTLQDAALTFEKQTGISVDITFGPQATWQGQALEHADIIYGSSEQSMLAVLTSFDKFNSMEVEPLYLRPATIIVRAENPKHITGLYDLTKNGFKIIVIDGSGASNTSGTGAWEDMIGRTKDIDKVRQFRKNIVYFAPNSGSARNYWQNNDDVDAWISWADWPIDNPNLGKSIDIESQLVVYRDVNIALASDASPEAKQFFDFLLSNKAKPIFKKRGGF